MFYLDQHESQQCVSYACVGSFSSLGCDLTLILLRFHVFHFVSFHFTSIYFISLLLSYFVCGAIGVACKLCKDFTFPCLICTMRFSHGVYLSACFSCSVGVGNIFFPLGYTSAPGFGVRPVTTDSIFWKWVNLRTTTATATTKGAKKLKAQGFAEITPSAPRTGQVRAEQTHPRRQPADTRLGLAPAKKPRGKAAGGGRHPRI